MKQDIYVNSRDLQSFCGTFQLSSSSPFIFNSNISSIILKRGTSFLIFPEKHRDARQDSLLVQSKYLCHSLPFTKEEMECVQCPFHVFISHLLGTHVITFRIIFLYPSISPLYFLFPFLAKSTSFPHINLSSSSHFLQLLTQPPSSPSEISFVLIKHFSIDTLLKLSFACLQYPPCC